MACRVLAEPAVLSRCPCLKSAWACACPVVSACNFPWAQSARSLTRRDAGCWSKLSRGSAPDQAAHRARRTRRSSRMDLPGPALSYGRTLGRATASLVVAARSRNGPRLRDYARGAAEHRRKKVILLLITHMSFVYYANIHRKLAPGVVCHNPPMNFHCPVRLVPEYPIAGEHTPYTLVHFRSGAILSVSQPIVRGCVEGG